MIVGAFGRTGWSMTMGTIGSCAHRESRSESAVQGGVPSGWTYQIAGCSWGPRFHLVEPSG